MFKIKKRLFCFGFLTQFMISGSLWAQPNGNQSSNQGFVDEQIFGFTIGQLGSSFLILLLAFMLRRIVTRFIFARLKQLAAKTEVEFDDDLLEAVEKPASWFLLFLAVYLSAIKLPLSASLEGLINNLFRGSSMFIIVWAMIRLVDVFGDLAGKTLKEKDSAFFGFLPLIKKTFRAFIIIVGMLIIIDNLGYNVSGILATLGLGGAALALASKDTIANLFGSLMIVLDRPFKVGDWIQVGNKVDGDVEEIGLRSTKVRTWPKTVISIPNSVLANEYINNWSRMPKRRVKQVVGLTYGSTADEMDAIVEDIRNLLKEDEGVQKDFILVNFTDFNAYSLDILVYYFTTTTQWLEHMNVRQRINTKIMRAVEKRGLSMAFPTRTVHLEGDGAKSIPGLTDSFHTDPPQTDLGHDKV